MSHASCIRYRWCLEEKERLAHERREVRGRREVDRRGMKMKRRCTKN